MVIGRDGADARLLTKVWRSTLYRDAGPSIAVTRSAQLEHRAYMHLMAAKAGVPVSEVVIAASGGRDDTALLALAGPRRSALSELPSDEITDDVLDSAWTSLARLHDARLAHGKVAPENLVVGPDGSVALVDFALGSAGGPPERLVRDQVDLLVSTAGLVGDDRALAAAMRAIGPEGLAELLPMVTTAALSTGARQAIDDPRKRLKELREGGAALSGCEVPDAHRAASRVAEQLGHGGRHVPRLLPDRRSVRGCRPLRDLGRGCLGVGPRRRAVLVRAAVLRVGRARWAR